MLVPAATSTSSPSGSKRMRGISDLPAASAASRRVVMTGVPLERRLLDPALDLVEAAPAQALGQGAIHPPLRKRLRGRIQPFDGGADGQVIGAGPGGLELAGGCIDGGAI